MIVYCKKKRTKSCLLGLNQIKLYNCIAISLKKQCWLLKQLEKEKYNKKRSKFVPGMIQARDLLENSHTPAPTVLRKFNDNF
jgi:hypothetical protein